MKILENISFSDGLTLPSGDDFVSKVFPNIWAFLVQLLAFIIMSIIVIKFAYKPVHNFLEKRRNYIQSNLDEAAKKNSEADKNIEMAKSNLNESKKEAIRLVEDAKKEAERQRDILLDETKKELMQKRQEASEDIRKEQEKAIKQVHDDVVDLAYETSKTILKREVNTKDDQKLIDDFVSDLIEKR